jgi:hypothetical protein
MQNYGAKGQGEMKKYTLSRFLDRAQNFCPMHTAVYVQLRYIFKYIYRRICTWYVLQTFEFFIVETIYLLFIYLGYRFIMDLARCPCMYHIT